MSLSKMKLIILLPLCVLPFVLSGCSFASSGINFAASAKAEQVVPILATIPVYPDSVEVSRDGQLRHSFPIFAFAHIEYKAKVNFAELKAFYIERLAQQGWHFESDKINWHNRQNLGGRIMTFRRDDYKLDIIYAGERAYFGWDYQVTVSWNTQE